MVLFRSRKLQLRLRQCIFVAVENQNSLVSMTKWVSVAVDSWAGIRGRKFGFGGGDFDAEGLGHLYPESGYMVTLLSGWGVGLSAAPPVGHSHEVTVGFVAGIFIAITLSSFQ